MDDIYVAIDVSKDNLVCNPHSVSFHVITDIGNIHKYVTSNYRVFKLSALPEVVRVETKIVDTDTPPAEA